jgi:hypothetical protein
LSLCFTDYPHYVPYEKYENAINRMVDRLSCQPGVIAIFQIGSISNPGISDIDMLAVFEDGTEYKLDPLRDLSKLDRYLFSHGLYGISKTYFHDAQRYTFFHNYSYLWGKEELQIADNDLSTEEVQTLKTQTALEYFVKMYVNIVVQHTYGIAKVRVLLLEAKALLHDLQFLNISSGIIFDLIKTVILWRDQWFEKKPNGKSLKKWFSAFYKELSDVLQVIFQSEKFYLQEEANLSIARNITLVPAKRLGYSHGGICLPSMFAGFGRKYFNLEHRFNNFNFYIPVTHAGCCKIINRRFEFLRTIKDYNNIHLIHYSPLVPSLNII